MESWTLSANAWVWLDRAFLSAQEAEYFQGALRVELPWAQRTLRMFGREVLEPRLVAWLGEPGAVYTYSGRAHPPAPWTPALTSLRQRVEARVGVRFNGVLANLYRDGNDSMGYHADDEPELGPAPTIASLSLGTTRTFVLRARKGATKLALELTHGSLCVMGGTTQHEFVHALPKRPRATGERINLTFRRIV